MPKHPVTLSLNPEIWKNFKSYCLLINSIPSGEVERFMIKKIKNFKKSHSRRARLTAKQEAKELQIKLARLAEIEKEKLNAE